MDNLLILLLFFVLVIGVFFLRCRALLGVLLLTVGCSSNLHHVKNSDLQQKNEVRESATHAQESVLKQVEQHTSVLTSDSATHWLWFQSAYPFWFHPTHGLMAENGVLYLGGNRVGNELKQENVLQSESTERDSAGALKTSLKEKVLVKNSEKVRVRKFWLVGLIGVVLVIVVFACFYKRLRFWFARHLK